MLEKYWVHRNSFFLKHEIASKHSSKHRGGEFSRPRRMVERSFSRIFEVELESDRLERECGLSLRGLEVNGLDQLNSTESHPSK